MAQTSAAPAQATTRPEQADCLKGFIVADAHFGWQDRRQPSPEKQREMMRRILSRFSDLDLFIDTGDIHHGNLRGEVGDRARLLWTKIIANGCGRLPFYLVPGNHEVTGTGEGDHEWRCARLANFSCRPYYSFDIKGVHFVSLPELVRTIYVTKESLEWLALDLAVNTDRTVIVLSHNSLQGTTTPYEEGYRGLANSRQVLELLQRHPNVLAWMHGHNHNYQVIEKYGKLFVSNGRIGGFDPSRDNPEGFHGLGGIYFEVASNGLTVRSFSAERGVFLDELGLEGVSGRLAARSSFNPKAAAGFSYGYGGARDDQRIPVYHHHVGPAAHREIFLAGAAGGVINDDPGFSMFMSRRAGRRQEPDWQLMGSSVVGPNALWEWANPGVRILPRTRANAVTTLTVPHQRHGRANYYRCPPGRAYRASVELEAGPGGQRLQLTFQVHDRSGRELARLPGPLWTLTEGQQRQQTEAQIPALAESRTLYADPECDEEVQLMVLADFSNLAAPVTVRRLELSFADADGPTRDAAIELARQRFGPTGPLAVDRPWQTEILAPTAAREVVTARAQGNRRMTWLIRHTNLLWQVRNAPAAFRDGRLEIGPLRNKWSPHAEVLLAPLARVPYPIPHRLRGVNLLRIRMPSERDPVLTMELLQLLSPAEIEVLAPDRPARVEGADDWSFASGRILIRRCTPGEIVVLARNPGTHVMESGQPVLP